MMNHDEKPMDEELPSRSASRKTQPEILHCANSKILPASYKASGLETVRTRDKIFQNLLSQASDFSIDLIYLRKTQWRISTPSLRRPPVLMVYTYNL